MKPWNSALKDGMITGSVAGLVSLAVLAVGGRAWGPVNAPSHWVWGNRALRQDDPSPRYTATGLVIHQLAAAFWGVLHELFLGRPEKAGDPAALLRDASVTTAVAAVVDLRLVPHRLTPGFQHRLSVPALVGVYSLFALGLALGSHLAGRRADGKHCKARR